MHIDSTSTFEKTWDAYFELKDVSNELVDVDTIVLDNPYKYRQIVSVGGSRSSKTWSILQLFMLELVRRNSIKITVWRDTKVTCRATAMEDFQDIIMTNISIYRNFKHNKQTGTFTYLPTKSKIVFEGADSPGKVLGSKQTISFFNEVTEFSRPVYLQITQRTSDRVICDYNPSMDFWLEKARFDDETIFIHSTFKDNYYCPENIVKQLLSYEPWEAGSYEIRGAELYYKDEPISLQNYPPPNDKNIIKGTANIYMWKVYGLGLGSEKPNKIYRGWQEISNDDFDAIDYISYFGLDFGVSSPTACMEVKHDGDRAFYIREVLYKPLQDIDESLPTVIHLEVPQIRKGHDIIACDSAKQKYIDLLLEAGYIADGVVKGGGSVEVGISLVQGFTIYYVKSENLQDEYDNYSWTIDRYGKSTDVPLKRDDHLMDSLRYIISYLVDYLGITI